MKLSLIAWIALHMLAGCASSIPDAIRSAPQPDVALSHAHA